MVCMFKSQQRIIIERPLTSYLEVYIWGGLLISNLQTKIEKRQRKIQSQSRAKLRAMKTAFHHQIQMIATYQKVTRIILGICNPRFRSLPFKTGKVLGSHNMSKNNNKNITC